MGFVYDAPAGLGCFVYMINRWFAPPANVPNPSGMEGEMSEMGQLRSRARPVTALKVYMCSPAKTLGKLSKPTESRLAAGVRWSVVSSTESNGRPDRSSKG